VRKEELRMLIVKTTGVPIKVGLVDLDLAHTICLTLVDGMSLKNLTHQNIFIPKKFFEKTKEYFTKYYKSNHLFFSIVS
jgi:hypothetical protein